MLRVTVLCVLLGRRPPSPDTGAYCRARAKLPERVLSRLVYDLADSLESRVPADWLWQGRHVKFVVVTTLTDAEHYCKDEIARLCRQRWHAELDLRNIKISLQMDDLRGQTPEMVRREIWVHWLAYNLIRKTVAQAALVHEKLPRQLSFAAALAAVAASWGNATLARQDLLTALAAAQFRVIAWHQVGDRPNRVEPRAIKRHPKPHPWLRQPRHEARARLCGSSPTP